MFASVARRLAGIGIVSLSCLLPGVAYACLPALPVTPADAEFEQTLAWDRADRVFIARLVRTAPVETAAPSLESLTRGGPMLEVTLTREQMLKGERELSPDIFEVLVRPRCVASDLERGQPGDQFVVYVEPKGSGVASGFIALSKLVEDRAIEALARPGIQSVQPEADH